MGALMILVTLRGPYISVKVGDTGSDGVSPAPTRASDALSYRYISGLRWRL